MWTDIDYMDARAIFTVDPARYPLERMREIVSNLHSNGQKYIVMVDPATAVRDYPTYNRGIEQDVFMKNADGSIYNGVVWPGRTSFPGECAGWERDIVDPAWPDSLFSFCLSRSSSRLVPPKREQVLGR